VRQYFIHLTKDEAIDAYNMLCDILDNEEMDSEAKVTHESGSIKIVAEKGSCFIEKNA
jgi:hypothetical protein